MGFAGSIWPSAALPGPIRVKAPNWPKINGMAAAKKVEGKVKRLREQAFELMSAEKYDRAVAIYEQLIRLDETNGEWARRAADCHWHLKNPDQRLKFSLLAARAYSEADLMLKAIAMCKVALSIDPNHRETQEELSRLYSRRPQVPPSKARRPRTPRHTDGLPPASRVAAAEVSAPRRSAPPTTPLEEERKEERTRARLAAAAALRHVRSQRRKDDVAQIPTKEEERILVPDAKERSARTPATRPPTPAFSSPLTPTMPALHLAPPREPHGPTLASLRLSERVPARNLESLPPARGNVYSLTLSEIPNAELTSARVPDIKLPQHAVDYQLFVPVIPPPEEEPPPDSALTVDISFGAPLSANRADISKRDFAGIPLLSDLTPEVLRQLITDVAMVELQPNEVLFNEGDPADAMYVVVEGSVTAVTLPHGEKPIQLAHLVEGDFFGEIGLMSDQPRGATVSAHEPTRLLRFDRDIIALLIEEDPSFLATLLQFLKDRLVENLMMSSPLFSPFSQHERYNLAEHFEFLEIEPDSILLESGQHPIGMYVLLTGEATMRGASDAGTVRRLGPGDIFGEQALLSNEVSKVEVRTSTKSFALCLPSDAFPEVMMSHPTVLEYLSTLSESSKGELDVAEDFLDHIRFF